MKSLIRNVKKGTINLNIEDNATDLIGENNATEVTNFDPIKVSMTTLVENSFAQPTKYSFLLILML